MRPFESLDGQLNGKEDRMGESPVTLALPLSLRSFSLSGMRIIFPTTAHIYTPIPLLDLLVSVVFKEDIPVCFSQAQQLPEEFCYATVLCVVRFAAFQCWVTRPGPHFC